MIPPFPPFLTSDRNSFAWDTARKRWPVILTKSLDDVCRTLQDLSGDKQREGKEIVKEIGLLKYDIEHDRPLCIHECDESSEMKEFYRYMREKTWLDSEWLMSECYLYIRLHNMLLIKEHWKDYDMFARQKEETLESSMDAVVELAIHYKEIVTTWNDEDSSQDTVYLENIFVEMINICLWGNATDLSLLNHLTKEEIGKIQGKKFREASGQNVIVNDLSRTWEQIGKIRNGQIDIVLDNAGYELFVDLVLAAFLLEVHMAETVILHPKSFPWFVSDVTPRDVSFLFGYLLEIDKFPTNHQKKVLFLVQRLAYFHSEGRICIRPNKFWSTPNSFWIMPTAATELFADLQKSDLVIFKGDLNYRKLVADAKWPATSSFIDALGPLGHGCQMRILALRTCKADTIVGLHSGQEEELDSIDKDWRINGKYAVISFKDKI